MQRSIGLSGGGGVSLAESVERPRLGRRLPQIAAAVAVILGALAMVKLAMAPVDGRAVGPGTPWAAHIQKMDEALARKDIGGAERAWHAAYVAALRARRWEGRLAVGEAYLQIGGGAKVPQTAGAKARENYLAALFLAREQGSLDGVLRVAEAFAALGDREVVDGCLRIADRLALGGGDPRAPARVRAFREQVSVRFVEAEGRP